MIKYFWFFILISNMPLVAQSETILEYKEFIDIVLSNHPIAKTADLFDEREEAIRLGAVAQFDPKLISDLERKYFKDTEYFTRWNSELKVQTPLAAEFSVGYENNDGGFLNSESSLPDNGLMYASVKLPLLSGLLFDESRYALRDAKLIVERNNLDRSIMINELVYRASLTYVKWLYAYLDVQNYTRAVEVTRERLTNSIALYENGDIPAIDTLESTINYNSMRFGLTKSRSKLIKARQEVDLFIWDQELNPMMLSDGVIPRKIQVNAIVEKLDKELNRGTIDDISNLPPLALYENKLESLELKRKLIKEDLKPTLDIKYNTLMTLGNDSPINFSANDYKFGLNFSYPFFARKTKAKLMLNEVDQMEANLAFKAKRLETELKIKNSFDQIDLIDQQRTLIEQNIQMNEVLLSAEREKFQIGESSIFLLNQRELKLLKSQLDLNVTEADYLQQYFNLKYILFER